MWAVSETGYVLVSVGAETGVSREKAVNECVNVGFVLVCICVVSRSNRWESG